MRSVGPRVAAWGFFGIGNLGNEASLAAFLSYMRQAHPEAVLTCIAPRPDVVRREHGVHGRQLMALRSDSRGAGALTTALKSVSRLGDIPRTWRLVGEVDVLTVPGTGVFESRLMASPWGMPYWLFLVALACRLRGRCLVILSVGAEDNPHPVTRWLDRWTVQLAHYCSYRDEASRDAMMASGVTSAPGPVVPDLAFALPPPERLTRSGGHVVIGVMAFDGRSEDRRTPADVRHCYLGRMTELTTRLVDEGRTVTIVIGDVHDEPVAEELERLVRSARPGLAPDTVHVSEARTFEAVMAEMAAAEVVVASRFHNVIAALKASRPTVSLGYADKNARLLAEFGLRGVDQPVDDFDVERVLSQILEARTGRSADSVSDLLSTFARRVDEQFRRVSDEFIGPRRRARSTRRERAIITGVRSASG